MKENFIMVAFRFSTSLFFTDNIARSPSTLWLLNCCAISGKRRSISSYIESVGSLMNLVEVSTAILLFQMSNNFFANTFAVSSRCKNTHILVVNWSVFTYRHKFADYRHAFSSSETIDRSQELSTFLHNHGIATSYDYLEDYNL